MAGLGTGRIAVGVVLVTFVASAIGYVIASAVLTFRDGGFRAEIDFFFIAENYLAIALPPSIERLLRHADLADGLDNRCALALQNVNLPKLRHDLFGLLMLPSQR